MKRSNQFLNLFLIVVFSFCALTFCLFLAPQANAEILNEEFTGSQLDPSWQVVPFNGHCYYSLTDNPGYLRYYLTGYQTYNWGWANNYTINWWTPSTTLIRPFSGDRWVFEAKASYNLHDNVGGSSTGAQSGALWIAFGDETNNYLGIDRAVDKAYEANVLTISLKNTGGAPENFSDNSTRNFKFPDDVITNEWVHHSYWYRIERNGQIVSVKISNDGVNYILARNFNLPSDVGSNQRAILTGACWAPVGSYTDWDYITVRSLNNPPVLSSIGDQSINEGQQLQFTVSASDPDGNALTYTASGVPEGAVLDPASGNFTWTPDYTQAGSYQVCFSVSDGSLTDSEDITITVNNMSQLPVLDPIGNKSIDEGQSLTFGVTATDPDGDNLTYTASGLPAGATFDQASGNFSWTPDYTQAGAYQVSFSVIDGGLTDSEEITITVSNITPIQLIEQLINEVKTSDFPDGFKNSIISKLENVIQSLDKGQNKAAINQLNAAINEVEAQQGKILSSSQAEQLNDDISLIVNIIGL